jgi:hypothetical protein
MVTKSVDDDESSELNLTIALCFIESDTAARRDQ